MLTPAQRRAVKRRGPKLIAQMKQAVAASAGDGSHHSPFGALGAKQRQAVYRRCVARDLEPRLKRL